MKMISSTSTTSTNGVTLISESDPLPPRRREPNPLPPPLPPLTEIAMLLSEGPFRQVQKLEREIVHASAQFTNPVAEEVVEDRCRNRRREAHGGRDQCERDARSDGFQARSAFVA